jgi:PHP family Zn ribbon phosphoesterase
MQIIADLQIHSKYARAVSPEMTIPNIAVWAKRKGIGLMATGDWTHPLWFREIEKNLEEIDGGILKQIGAPDTDPKFLLATEVSCIYSQGGKGRRNHTLRNDKTWV